jgi:hypothetical protein
MNKTATIICLALAVTGLSPALADSGKKKNKAEHAQGARPAHGAPAARAFVARPAHGAPAIGHAQAAQHASANARMHSRSEVVNGGGPATVRSNHHGVARQAETAAAFRNEGMSPTMAAARTKSQRVIGRQQNVNVAPNTNVNVGRNVSVGRNVNGRYVTNGNRVVNFTDARRSWSREHHHRDWWHNHYSRIVLYGGGYYYWNNGWWYPAYGYDPYYSNYAFDGPIYGYNDLPPGDVVSDTQRALAEQGYYNGPIDGLMGPGTRGALRRFQIDHGLAVTAAIDQPTLYSLGLA